MPEMSDRSLENVVVDSNVSDELEELFDSDFSSLITSC